MLTVTRKRDNSDPRIKKYIRWFNNTFSRGVRLLYIMSSKVYQDLNSFNFQKSRNSRLEMSYKKGILRNFTNFTGKQLCCSLLLIKLQALVSSYGVDGWME